jgi:hypothetical protein
MGNINFTLVTWRSKYPGVIFTSVGPEWNIAKESTFFAFFESKTATSIG